MKKLSFVIFLPLILAGCLTTQAQLREEESKRAQVSAAQEKRAQEVARLDEFEDEFRSIRGRIEVVENQVAQANNGQAERFNNEKKARIDLESKFSAYEEALKKLEEQVVLLENEVKTLKSKKDAAPAATAKDTFKNAEAAFGKKDWKQAIVEYEAYRKANPKGKNYSTATYKIGAAFHELNMKDEARSFYEEVVAKFPSSKEAKKASQKLKAMK